MKRLLLLPLFLAACSSEPPRGQTRTLAPEPGEFRIAKGEASADDIALFLAGRPVARGAGLSQLQQSGAYQDHAADMALKWRVFASKRVARQQAWSDDQLRPALGKPRVLLYPFGGPDLLHATALFPDASTYVLLGLEPAGGLPAPDAADPGALPASLQRFGRSMDSQLKHGYFITRDIKGDLAGGPLPGVTPILLAGLA